MMFDGNSSAFCSRPNKAQQGRVAPDGAGLHRSKRDFSHDQRYAAIVLITHNALSCCYLIVQMNEVMAVVRILKVLRS